MKFIEQNKSFELWISNYQFPDITDDYYDSNWLIVGIKLSEFEKNWITSDASLLTYEYQRLSKWLKQAIGPKIQDKKIEFIEPNLEFELVDINDNNCKIRIYLNLESKPGWHKDDWGYSIDITVKKEQIENSIERIESDLLRFPVRLTKSSS